LLRAVHLSKALRSHATAEPLEHSLVAFVRGSWPHCGNLRRRQPDPVKMNRRTDATRWLAPALTSSPVGAKILMYFNEHTRFGLEFISSAILVHLWFVVWSKS